MTQTCQIELITIKAGKLRVTIAPEIGGSIASFDVETSRGVTNIFRPLQNFDYDRRRVLDMGCFPLIPYSNRIRDGKFYVGDTQVQIPNNCIPDPHPSHGTGWQNPWQVMSTTENSALLQLPLDSSLPIHYGGYQDISLTPDALIINLSASNLGREAFPVGLGLHPYFPRKDTAKITANIPSEWTLDQTSMPIYHHENSNGDEFAKAKPAQSLKEMSAYSGWDGRAHLGWEEENISLDITTQPSLAHLLMWAPPQEDFFCLEPVSHAIDGFNLAHQGHDNVGGTMLQPGKTYSQKFIFRVQCG